MTFVFTRPTSICFYLCNNRTHKKCNLLLFATFYQVQFEVAHNLIHALVGGNSTYGLSSLSYSAFDPIFYLHHSNVDRIWAIWTALQQLR